jgi:two-component system response regulator RegX3
MAVLLAAIAVTAVVDESSSSSAEPASDLGVPIHVGDVHIDPGRHEVLVRGQAVGMPLKEFDLLVALASNAGRVPTRDQLIDKVWGHDVGSLRCLTA